MFSNFSPKWQDLYYKAKSYRLRYPLAAKNRESRSPFFIMGSGRCGTTLMRKLLEQNPEIVIPPESGALIKNSIKLYIKWNGLPWASVVEKILDLWQQNSDFELWGIDDSISRKWLTDLPIPERNLQIIIDHIYRTYSRIYKPQAHIWGDKSPYATFGLAWLKELYPQAPIIHMLRDGRDVVNSLLKHGICEDIYQACDRWNRAVDILSKPHGRMRIITVRYEQLVTDPKKELGRLSEVFGIPLVYSENLKEVYLGDNHLMHHGNLSKPINARSVGAWENDLAVPQKRRVAKLLEGNLKKMGYVQ